MYIPVLVLVSGGNGSGRLSAKVAVLHRSLEKGGFAVFEKKSHCSVLSGERNVLWRNTSNLFVLLFCKTK